MATTVEELLDAGNEASGQARNSWITFILFGAYVAVAVGATTHKQLLLEGPIELPLLGVKLPLKAFYQLVPGLFVLVHFYTLVQLYLLSRTLHLLNSAIETGIPLAADRDQLRARIDSFVVTQLISCPGREWLPQLFIRFAVWITLLAAPVLLLLAFQLQFLAYHDVTTTWVHRIALMVDLFLIWLLWPAVVHPSGQFGGALSAWIRGLFLGLRRAAIEIVAELRYLFAHGPRVPFQQLWRFFTTAERLRDAAAVFGNQIAGVATLVVICGIILAFSLLVATVPGESMETRLVASLTDLPANRLPKACVDAARSMSATATLDCLAQPAIWFASTAVRSDLGAPRLPNPAWWPTVILFEGTPDVVSSTPNSWFSRNIVAIDADLTEVDGDKLAGLERTVSLRGRHFENAVLYRVDLRKADLTGALLAGAVLGGARLNQANLTDADLQGAYLGTANLQGANLSFAKLNGAILTVANLEGATLSRAELRGAAVFGANFRAVDMTGARAQGIHLNSTELADANLSGAALQGADLGNANLRAADLDGAELQGAVLAGADLRGAYLGEATLYGADLSTARLRGADLRAARVWRARAPRNAAAFDHTDQRYIDLAAPSATEIAAQVKDWLAVIPAGPRRETAGQRLAPLTANLDAEAERGLSAPWIARRDRGWDVARDDPSLADYLAGLGCDQRAAPFVARGLVRRIRLSDAKRPYVQHLAASLLDAACKGDDDLGKTDRVTLQRLAGRLPPGVGEEAETAAKP